MKAKDVIFLSETMNDLSKIVTTSKASLIEHQTTIAVMDRQLQAILDMDKIYPGIIKKNLTIKSLLDSLSCKSAHLKTAVINYNIKNIKDIQRALEVSKKDLAQHKNDELAFINSNIGKKLSYIDGVILEIHDIYIDLNADLVRYITKIENI